MTKNLSHERLLELLHYDPETGIFTWKKTTSFRVKVGAVAGTVMPIGYLKTAIDGKQYYLHRLAWFYVHGAWPAAAIDHENLNKLDNRISNLREADYSKNQANVRRRANNASGFKGVWRKRNKFTSQIKCGGQHLTLGVFDTAEEAHAAYCAAAEKLFGEFARAA